MLVDELVDEVVGGRVDFVVELVVAGLVVAPEVVVPVVEVPVDVLVREDGRVVAEALPGAATVVALAAADPDDVPAAEVPSTAAPDPRSEGAGAMVSPATTVPPSPAELQAARPMLEAPRTTPVTTVRRLKTG